MPMLGVGIGRDCVTALAATWCSARILGRLFLCSARACSLGRQDAQALERPVVR